MNIPFRLNLEQQKKRAKELLKDFYQQKAEAICRFDQQHPMLVHKEQSLIDFTPKLADAQLVISRELGCKTWSQLRNHIALMDALRGQVDHVSTVHDEPARCLHIRCGSDIEQTISEAGFKGTFLEFSDPFCVGPVSYDYHVEERAHFLYNSYGKLLGRDYSEVLAGLRKAYQRFRDSAVDYDNAVLWFEHDTYDQFILIFLLSQYHRFGLPKHLWIVTTNDFPGTVRFQGLGQLPPEGLRLLWQTKQPVTKQHCAEADQHWMAFTDPNREVFHQYVQHLTGCTLSYFKTAALRQLQEQPVQQNQLPLTQQITVDLLSGSTPQSAGQLFKKIMEQKEPLPFLGDLMYWHILIQMKENGLIRFVEESEHWPDTVVTLA